MRHRSWLFVPGDSEKKLAKIPDCGADIVIIDLEDSVAPDRKAIARERTARYVDGHAADGMPQLWVRINPVSSGLYPDDLNSVIEAAPAGIVLPKPGSVDDVWIVDKYLGELERLHGLGANSVRVLAIATETAAGVMNLAGYQNSPARLWGLTWGAEDLAADLGATTNRDDSGDLTFTFRLARSMCQLSATAAGLPAIDGIVADFTDEEKLRQYAQAGRRDGFSGMLAIHPNQVETINEAYTPSAAEIDAAQRVVDAFAKEEGAGVISLDGRMLDRPHLRQAERILEMAAL